MTEERCVVRFSGSLDVAERDAVRNAFESAIPEATARGGAVVDLTECDYVDSTFLTELVRFSKRLPGLRVAVATGTRQIARVFELTQLDQIFPVAGTLEEAVDRLSG